jgi:hypothetical protein
VDSYLPQLDDDLKSRSEMAERNPVEAVARGLRDRDAMTL